MEGSLTSVNNSLSSQYVCLALQHFHRSLSQTLILEKRMFVWFHSTFTGHEVKHSSLQEEKSNAFEMVPFIETKNGPHLLYWGCSRQPWGKSFLCQLIPLFHSHSDLNFSSGYRNFCSGLTVADGGWSNTLRSSSVGKQTNMQEEQLQGGVHYHQTYQTWYWWRTLPYIGAHFFCIFYCFLQVLSPEQGWS